MESPTHSAVSVVKEYRDPLSESQMANEDSMLGDAPPVAKFKSTPKRKGCFSENCRVLQSFGKALICILRLLK